MNHLLISNGQRCPDDPRSLGDSSLACPLTLSRMTVKTATAIFSLTSFRWAWADGFFLESP